MPTWCADLVLMEENLRTHSHRQSNRTRKAMKRKHKLTRKVNHLRLSCYLAVLGIMATHFVAQAQFQRVLRTVWSAQPFGLDIMEAGRVNAIAVHPGDDRIVLVGTASGGLFRSTDGAQTFSHCSSFPGGHTPGDDSVIDVKFVGAGGVAIATRAADPYRTDENISIWRSTDGGLTWTALPDHPPHPYFPRRMSALGVDVSADGRTVYVGSNRGLSKSTDAGATWSHDFVFPPGDSTIDPTVWAVKSIGNGVILAGGGSGLRRWSPGTGQWRPTSSAIGSLNSPHAIDGNSGLAFVVNSRDQLFRSEDSGLTWQAIPSAPPGSGDAGGIPLVRFRFRSFDAIEVYFGNRLSLRRLRASRPNGNSPFDFSGGWEDLPLDHPDTRCLVWNNRNEPYLLGTDGGLLKARDAGDNWRYTAGCRGGLVALQVMEVTGEILTSLGRRDLYIGTQDTKLWASPDDGVTWPASRIWEGQHIQCLRRTSSSSPKMSYKACSGCSLFMSEPLFRNEVPWTGPPVAREDPVILAEDTFLQPVGAGAPFAAGLALTKDHGQSWGQAGVFPETPFGLPTAVVGRLQTTVYQPVRFGETNGMDRVGLARIALTPDGAAMVGYRGYPSTSGLGSLGVTEVVWDWYEVFAVDPGNANHLIAADAVGRKVVRSLDGGLSWQEIPGLASLVTHAGTYTFTSDRNPRATFVSAISFCPDNPLLVLLGTQEAGVLTSSDGGETWQQVPDTDRIQPVTGFYWRNWNDVIVSTYGRGLWRLQGTARLAWQYRFDVMSSLLQDVVIPVPPGLAHAPVSHLVYGGPITGVFADKGSIQRIHVAPGGSHLIVSDGQEVGSGIEIVETAKEIGFIGFDKAPQPPVPGWVPVGLTYEKDGELAVTYAPEPMAFPGTRDRTQDKSQPDEPSPTAKQPYLWLSHLPPGDPDGVALGGLGYGPGETVRVSAVRFDSTRAADLRLTLDDLPLNADLKWSADGEFEATFSAPLDFGRHRLLVTQKTPTSELKDGVSFFVHPEDGEADGPPADQPTLTIRVKGETLVLSWPASLTGYRLESTATPTEAASWQPWPDPPFVVGDENTVSFRPIFNPPLHFFRLRQIGGNGGL